LRDFEVRVESGNGTLEAHECFTPKQRPSTHNKLIEMLEENDDVKDVFERGIFG
jgi:transcriptional/translational regulatory protein YebC/TACO1